MGGLRQTLREQHKRREQPKPTSPAKEVVGTLGLNYWTSLSMRVKHDQKRGQAVWAVGESHRAAVSMVLLREGRILPDTGTLYQMVQERSLRSVCFWLTGSETVESFSWQLRQPKLFWGSGQNGASWQIPSLSFFSSQFHCPKHHNQVTSSSSILYLSSTPYLPLLVSSSPVGPSQHLGISISHDLLSEPLPSKYPPCHWDIRPSHSSAQNLPDTPHLHSSHQETGSKQLKLALGFS